LLTKLTIADKPPADPAQITLTDAQVELLLGPPKRQ
jgi:hypothetical protein